MSADSPASGARPTLRLHLAVGLASAAVAAWEVGLARLAGLLFGRTLAWICLSLALLALGLGGWWAARRLDRGAAAVDLARTTTSVLPVALLLAGWLCSWHDLAWLAGTFTWPFAVFGALLAASWRLTRDVGVRAGAAPAVAGEAGSDAARGARARLYRWELFGAAAGLAGVGPSAVAWAGAPAACAVAALLAAAAAALAGSLRSRPTRTRRDAATLWATLGGVAAAVALFAVGFGGPVWPTLGVHGPGFDTHLRRTARSTGAVLVATRHSAWARTDVLALPRPAPTGPTAATPTTAPPALSAYDRRWVFTDGHFVARSVPWDGVSAAFPLADDTRMARLKRVAFRARPGQRSVLVIGAGAGFDVAVALQEGATQVTAVEINRDTVALTRSWSALNGRVFSRPEVEVVVADARRWAGRTPATWDQVQLALVETAPTAVRGQATAHGRLLTREALQLWRARLSPEGVCVILHNTKRLHDATQAQLRALLGDRYEAEVLAVHVPAAAADRDPFSHAVLWSRRPWRAAERERVATQAAAAGAVRSGAASRAAPGTHRGAAPRGAGVTATDERPVLFERAPFGLAALALGVAFFGLLRVGRGRRRRPMVAAAFAGAGLCWLQMSGTAWAYAALGQPSLALGLTLAALLGGAGVGTLVPALRRRTALAGWSAALLAALGAPMSASLATQPVWVAAAGWTLAVTLLATPLAGPWLAALAAASEPDQHGAQAADGDEGRVVAADGLGALAAAGLVGVGVATVGLSGVAFAGAACLWCAGRVVRRAGR